MEQHFTPIEFLQTLYPEPLGLGKLVLRTSSRPTGRRRSHWLPTVAEACARGMRYTSARESFISTALHDLDVALAVGRELRAKRTAESVVGCEASAVALSALWVDLDVAGHRARHGATGGAAGAGAALGGRGAEAALPPGRREALALLEAVGPAASIIVDSGGGYHAYWLLRRRLVLETRRDRGRAKRLLRRVQGAVHATAAEKGWAVDHGGDLARMLRLPGSQNLKYSPARPVRVVQFPLVHTPGAGREGDFRYEPEEFDHLADPPPEAPGAGLRALAAGLVPSTHDLAPILASCPFAARGETSAHLLPRAQWELLVRILIWCVLDGLQGHQLAHAVSRRHSGYHRDRTDEQIDQALREDPPTCLGIDAACGADSLCGGCTWRGRIEGPLDLARPAATAGALPIVEAGAPAAGAPAPGGPKPEASGPRGPEPALATGAGGGRVPLLVTVREHEVAVRALAVLAEREPNLFVRGGRLVQIVHPGAGDAAQAGARPPGRSHLRRPGGSPVVRSVHEARLRELLAAHCAFASPVGARAAAEEGEAATGEAGGGPAATGREEVEARPVRPPRWLVRALLNRGAWPGLPELAGVVECPVLRPGGAVLQRPGFDPGSGLLYAPTDDFLPVPERPGREDAEAAWAALHEAVKDFPFAGAAHRAAWLAALLTPLARADFSGPSPLHLIDANVSGCGKSLLADVVSTLLTGRGAARMSYPGSEGELRKAITAIALEACPMVLIDNVAGPFGSPTLDRALTAEIWRDRVLGKNVQVALPLTVTWYATGNNVELVGDTPRRCLHIRLESRFEHPEKRAGFAHPRLLEWLRRERRRLLPAAVTILRAYVVAGRPPLGLPGWGSYEGWSDLVRSAVVWLGLPDPAAGRGRLEAADAGEKGVLSDLIGGLEELLAPLGGAATTRRILDTLAAAPEEAHPRLRSALESLFPDLERGALPPSVPLAGRLRSYRGRVVGGAFIDQAPKTWQGVRWRVRRWCGGPPNEKGEKDA